MKAKGLSNRFVRGVHMVLHEALDQAMQERLISINPTNGCRIPKLEKKEMKVIPPEQIGAYPKAAAERGMLPMFYLELISGLRRGELLTLFWSDLDGRDESERPQDAQLHPHRGHPKGNRRMLIAEHEKHPDSPYLFMSPITGYMFHPDTIGRVHENLLDQAGIDHAVKFHDLRHPYVKAIT